MGESNLRGVDALIEQLRQRIQRAQVYRETYGEPSKQSTRVRQAQDRHIFACLHVAVTTLRNIEFNQGRNAEDEAKNGLVDLDRFAEMPRDAS